MLASGAPCSTPYVTKAQTRWIRLFNIINDTDAQIEIAVSATARLGKGLFGATIAAACFNAMCNLITCPQKKQELVCKTLIDTIKDRHNLLRGLAEERLKRLGQQRVAIIQNPTFKQRVRAFCKGMTI